jgi:hypothetical protein
METISSTLNNTEVVKDTTQDTDSVHHHKIKNFYPEARHILLVVFVLLCLCIIFFLVHQNGKSIYENGL